ncbi:MAG: hypothetical protein E4G94_02790 [ANME-2 cluster archaeon]|nr:MAG: hypothetical protein E4G94_02790 [ANME-2 cluster archaeon]
MDKIDLTGPINHLKDYKKMYELQLQQKQLGNRYIVNTMGNLELMIQNYKYAIEILTNTKENQRAGSK